jgi:hypothetical protein
MSTGSRSQPSLAGGRRLKASRSTARTKAPPLSKPAARACSESCTRSAGVKGTRALAGRLRPGTANPNAYDSQPGRCRHALGSLTPGSLSRSRAM